jgi:hypothetical protein
VNARLAVGDTVGDDLFRLEGPKDDRLSRSKGLFGFDGGAGSDCEKCEDSCIVERLIGFSLFRVDSR